MGFIVNCGMYLAHKRHEHYLCHMNQCNTMHLDRIFVLSPSAHKFSMPYLP